MEHRFEKQAEHILIQQRDREVTRQIRELLNKKQKRLKTDMKKEQKWYQFWRSIRKMIEKLTAHQK